MAQAKKFGTFAGVFTPSILTILGVIMYLRLGWIVGQAGFYAVIGLIIVAHIISVSTGLSLSSIATDKKIKTGGIYYMLSRSLGLPMGGSIGITIFLGTALSISLYIVGFVENFLSIEAIHHFLGMSGSVNDIRLIGTAVIIVLVIIAYISTSIAIKTQFFILGAIALSLVSIVLGIIVHPEIQASTPSLMPHTNSPDLIVLFALFFPAVTGFTAGVAMSGDLKSPKDSIPKGTLLAIGTGLMIYLGLAAVFAFYIDRDLLLSDTNFLLKVAWFTPFVIAGIWGATLSSALGGILGAPRILQAMSGDKVTHSFFAKGVGNNNEPRRALILTFLLAEIGILIGELDVIAGIVSMFYIAAYGFINLAYVLERWANSDFRPSLKISIWIGIIGFVASIGVMLKIDTLGMILAFLIMFGIYFFLKRREVQGNITDVWQSVWTSIIRTSLNRINKKPLNESNWQPNIILFSGGGNSRPHLLELGVNIAGKQGFLSNFDLHISGESEILFPKSQQKIATEIEEQNTGVFTRRQSVSNLYQGIEMIAQTYGFSGVEPNTVMMGWARESSDPVRFSQLIYNLATLDMNVILLDYDKNRGWGNMQSIDIWWRGGGNNGNLALTLAKFITLSEDWAQAKIRLLIVNSNNDTSESIHESAAHILENLRISAEIRIINNEFEQRSFYDIIELESVDTDLIFLGFPPIIKGEEAEFVERTNKLCRDIGTVAIIQASSQFKNLNLGEISPNITGNNIEHNLIASENLSQSFQSIEKIELESYVKHILKDLEKYSQDLGRQLISPIFEKQLSWLDQVEQASLKSFDNLISRAPNNQVSTFRKTIAAQHQIFIRGQQSFAEKNIFGSLQDHLNTNLIPVYQSSEDFKKAIAHYPYRVKTKLSKKQFIDAKVDRKIFKKSGVYLSPLFLIASKIPYYVHFRELLQNHFPQSLYSNLQSLSLELYKDGFQFENEYYKLMQKISGLFEATIELCQKSVPSSGELLAQKTQISNMLHSLKEQKKQAWETVIQKLNIWMATDTNLLIDQLNHPLSNAFVNNDLDWNSVVKKKKQIFAKSIETWIDNKQLSNDVHQLNMMLLSFRFSSQNNLIDLELKLRNILKQNIGQPLKELIEVLKLANDKPADKQKSFISSRLKNLHTNLDVRLQQIFMDQYSYSLKKIKSSINQFPEQLTIYTEKQNTSVPSSEMNILNRAEVSVKRTVDYLVEKELADIQEMIINLGQEINLLKVELSEIVQMILLPSSSDEPEKDEYKKMTDSHLDYEELLHMALEKASSLEEKLISKQNFLQGLIIKKTAGFKANLELYPFIRSIQELRSFIKTAQTKRWFNKVYKIRDLANVFVSNQLNKLWYNQSSGLILAQKLSKSVLHQETRVETLLKFKDEVSPSSKMMKQLPDYYKQLFLRKQFYLNEFWVGREEETSAFQNSFKQWKAGYGGGIIVLGERNSGKSFFANYQLQKLDIKGETYFVNPPYAGSVSVLDFSNSLQTVTEINGGLDFIFDEIPAQSVFVFDDLELWWEKSSQGMKVIEQLVRLINKYGQKHLFIILGNIHSFNLINKYKKIESAFLGLIELRPFNAKLLKEIVMRRHATSSMEFTINHVHQNRYRSWNYARLFSRYFNYSEGNPGVTLQAWIKSVEEVNSNILVLKKPKMPDISPLRFLETEWMIFILHFLLHKRMDLDKLLRVSQESEEEVSKRIGILKRAGVIVQTSEGIYDINPYVLPFLRKALVKRELL